MIVILAVIVVVVKMLLAKICMWYYDKIPTNDRKIQIIPHFNVVTRTQRKLFGFTFIKRFVPMHSNDDFTTFPYGFKM